MIVNTLFILWFVFIAVLMAALVGKMVKNTSVFPFQNYEKTDIPYITLEVQGFLLNFLVDTGCGVSIIAKGVLSHVEYTENSRQIHLEALTPDSLHAGMVTIPISVNNRQVSEDFVVYDRQDIANFQVNYGISIHGILGNEFLEKTNCKIDYKNHIVVIS